jgi:hypothetical protein
VGRVNSRCNSAHKMRKSGFCKLFVLWNIETRY